MKITFFLILVLSKRIVGLQNVILYFYYYDYYLLLLWSFRFCLPGPKPSAVANISHRVVHPGAPAIPQCSHDSDFSDNIFPSQGSVCCCRSNSSTAYAHFTHGNNVNASADTKAGFLTKKPLCCLLKDGNTSDVFFCAVASCEDGVGKPLSEQKIAGNSFVCLKSETQHVCNCSKTIQFLFFPSWYT